MATGIVKWFNVAKDYGFISPDSGGRDVFVHVSALEESGLTALSEGAASGRRCHREPKGAGSGEGSLGVNRNLVSSGGQSCP